MASTRTATSASASRLRWTVLAAASLALLAACGKQDDRTVGQKVDAAVNSAEQKTDAAAETLKKESAELKARTQETTDKVVAKVEDAAITTAVNAALAKDASLSVLSINVDTTAGAVVLRGSVPSTTARDRATGLAMAVKGVHRVDNQLLVKG